MFRGAIASLYILSQLQADIMFLSHLLEKFIVFLSIGAVLGRRP